MKAWRERGSSCLALLDRPEPAPITTALIRQVHRELMGDIYPFAGEWRTVDLHKGEGPTKWPLPPSGIQPIMDIVRARHSEPNTVCLLTRMRRSIRS